MVGAWRYSYGERGPRIVPDLLPQTALSLRQGNVSSRPGPRCPQPGRFCRDQQITAAASVAFQGLDCVARRGITGGGIHFCFSESNFELLDD